MNILQALMFCTTKDMLLSKTQHSDFVVYIIMLVYEKEAEYETFIIKV